MTRYTSANNYIKKTFGIKLYKISIDAGFTCPTRDGSIDRRGCIFCSASGSGDFAGDRGKAITEQIEEGKKRVEAKLPKALNQTAYKTDYPNTISSECKNNTIPRYIAYFQAYTNTYAPVDVLRSKYMEAINHPDIAVVSIATRPDCLSEDVAALLAEINQIKPVWVELGLQTIHDESAQYIRRGFSLEAYNKAVSMLRQIGITQIITHIILGLPNESEEMMLESVKYVVDSGASGIKLQLLHVQKNTDLEKDYLMGTFSCMSMEEYISLIEKCIKLIPDNIVVHRITGDGPKKLLVAPLWSANKKLVLNALSKVVKPQDIC